jgi:hypothetical protein
MYFQNLLEMLYLVAFSNFSLGPSQINRFFAAHFTRLNIEMGAKPHHISPYFSMLYLVAFSEFLALWEECCRSDRRSVRGFDTGQLYQKKVVFSRFLFTGWAQFDAKHLVGMCRKFYIQWCAWRHTIVGDTKTATPSQGGPNSTQSTSLEFAGNSASNGAPVGTPLSGTPKPRPHPLLQSNSPRPAIQLDHFADKK